MQSLSEGLSVTLLVETARCTEDSWPPMTPGSYLCPTMDVRGRHELSPRDVPRKLGGHFCPPQATRWRHRQRMRSTGLGGTYRRISLGTCTIIVNRRASEKFSGKRMQMCRGWVVVVVVKQACDLMLCSILNH